MEVWSTKERSGLEKALHITCIQLLVDDEGIEKPVQRSRPRRESQGAPAPSRGKVSGKEGPLSFAHHTRPS